MKTCQLTTRAVAAARERGYYADGGNLYLQVSKFGTRSWVFRYTVIGTTRDMGLGSIETVSLELARELAGEQRELLIRGDDPIETRAAKRRRIAQARMARKTFAECAEAYIAQHGPKWRSDKYRHQVKRALDIASKRFDRLDVKDIDTDHVVSLLEPIWRRTPVTASRIRGLIEQVLDWATVSKFREGPNPARWDGHLEHLLRALPKATHFEALPFDQVPAFMVKLRAVEGVRARAVEFAILTAARSNEVRGMRWEEVKDGVWTEPVERTKRDREHRVPLSGRALEILDATPRAGDHVFVNESTGRPLDDKMMLNVVKRLGDTTVHGISRSSFRDWAGDRTSFSHETIEFALAHKIPDKTAAAYRRYSAMEKRAKLMEAWARYCSSPSNALADVVALHG